VVRVSFVRNGTLDDGTKTILRRSVLVDMDVVQWPTKLSRSLRVSQQVSQELRLTDACVVSYSARACVSKCQ
jgi:hypothetical protein